MLLSERNLRKIIRQTLIENYNFKNKLLFEGREDDIKAGDNLTWAKTGRSLTVLTNPVYDQVSKSHLVLCVWDGSDNPNISYIKKYGKKAPPGAWDQTVDRFNDIYRPTAEGSDKKRKTGFKDALLNKDWLSKNGNSSITDKQINQYKKKWRRVAVVNIKYLQTNKEFTAETADFSEEYAQIWGDFKNWSDVALDLLSIAFPGAGAFIQGTKTAIKWEDAIETIFVKKDFIEGAWAIMGLLPLVGGGSKAIGKTITKVPGGGKAVKTVAGKIVDILKGILKDDLKDMFKKLCVRIAANYSNAHPNEKKKFPKEFAAHISTGQTLGATGAEASLAQHKVDKMKKQIKAEQKQQYPAAWVDDIFPKINQALTALYTMFIYIRDGNNTKLRKIKKEIASGDWTSKVYLSPA